MQKIARKILESYIFEKKILNTSDFAESPLILKEKMPVFVTAYDGDEVIASSGRIYPTHETALEELIDNTILLTKDARFEIYKENPERARKLRYRVDTFGESDRHLLHHPDELKSETEGIIILCQKQGKVGVILPHMFPESLSGEEVYHLAVKKIHLDTQHLGKGDVIIYALKTQRFDEAV